jgi:aspartyl-tRNA(Asn)/glutamyl-tRNA(Gln) amidotransferase subunit A
MRFGLPRRFYVDFPGLHPDVKSAAFAAFAELERQGARIVDVDAPTLDQTQAIWGAMLSEMYEYHRDVIREHPQRYRTPTRLLMLASALCSGHDLLRAQRLRARLAREVRDIFQGVNGQGVNGQRIDALVFPGASEPATPFPADPIPTELVRTASRYTNVWNLVGLPACVVPSGFSQDGLPVSIQIVGRPFDDATVLQIARAYERATPWHTRRPDPSGWTL